MLNKKTNNISMALSLLTCALSLSPRPVQISVVENAKNPQNQNEICIVEEGNFQAILTLDQKMTNPFATSTIDFDQIGQFVKESGFGYVPKFSLKSIQIDDIEILYLTYWHFIDEIQNKLRNEIDEHARFMKKLTQMHRIKPSRKESDEQEWEMIEIPLEDLCSFDPVKVMRTVRKSDQVCVFLVGMASGTMLFAHVARSACKEYREFVGPSDSSFGAKVGIIFQVIGLLWR